VKNVTAGYFKISTTDEREKLTASDDENYTRNSAIFSLDQKC
jgi:hypothetical protein